MKKIKRFKTDFDNSNFNKGDLPNVTISKESLEQKVNYSEKFSVQKKLNFDDVEVKSRS